MHLAGSDPVVLALPPGGVPVGFEVARALGVPLDLFDPGALPPVRERTVVVVADGLITGAILGSCADTLRRQGARHIVLATPVGAPRACLALRAVADEVICALAPEPLVTVGAWYEHFPAVSDAEVRWWLERARAVEAAPLTAPLPGVGVGGGPRPIDIDLGSARVHADLAVPRPAHGIVLFAHGCGSNRLSPRNRVVAALLQRRGLATLLVDLLTEDEARFDAMTRHLRCDIPHLARRLGGALGWLGAEPETSALPACLFGASTGAAAALVTAAGNPRRVRAIVSRSGRTDLAGPSLASVPTPTLLVVGERDQAMVALNRASMPHFAGPVSLRIVPGAGPLFEEPGALDGVAELAAQWFLDHLRAPLAHAS